MSMGKMLTIGNLYDTIFSGSTYRLEPNTLIVCGILDSTYRGETVFGALERS